VTKDNILVIAYACEPNSSSEPGVGWNFSTRLARDSNVWVVTRSNNRDIIEDELNTNPENNINWIYVDLPSPFRWLKKNMPLGTQFYYMLWQWIAYFKCRKLIKEVNFTLSHHLTFGVTWLAPIISLLNVPFVWGPIGGGDTVPMKYIFKERIPSIAQETLYATLTRIVCHVSLLNYIARKRSRAILFRSSSVECHFPKTNPESRFVISETALCGFRESPTIKPDTIQALCIGRHQYWKGYKYAIEGFCKYLADGGTGVLRVLGDGPENSVLKQVHRSYGSPDGIKFLGNVSHNEVLKNLEVASVLIHPSFRDGGSWSVVESLSRSVPVIAQNASGTTDIVTEDCGIIIDTVNIKLGDGIAEALHRLANDKNLLERLSKGSLDRIKNDYLWDKRCKDLKNIYHKIS